MEKVDYRKLLSPFYGPKTKPEVVDMPPLAYLMIDGKGDPNTAQAYKDSLATLFGLSYTLKFLIKKELGGPDYGVMPLEGLWWTEPIEKFSMDSKENWLWTSMMMQPKPVTPELVELAKDRCAGKGKTPLLDLVRYECLVEGTCAQILHIGPYAEEEPTIARLHSFIQEKGLKLRGKHHEIYLNSALRTAPERLRTVIRQPVE